MRKRLLELKVGCEDTDRVRRWLEAHARKVSHGRQVDTYFHVPRGRLKLREVEGGDGGSLIYYRREDQEGPKTSEVLLWRVDDAEGLRKLLEEALGTLVVVDKLREVYRWGQVQVHVDEVDTLGDFVEFEREVEEGEEESKARGEFRLLMEALDLREQHLVAGSYSDLLMSRGE
jgi:predicted adenylyl cyclase CyaB